MRKEHLEEFKIFIDYSLILKHTILQDSPKSPNSPVEIFYRTFRNL